MADTLQVTPPTDRKEAADRSLEVPAEKRSRRSFIAGAVAAAAIAPVVPTALQAQGRVNNQGKTAMPKGQAVEPIDWQAKAVAAPTEWSNPLARLVRRATMGIDEGMLNQAKAMGYQAWLQSQLDYTRIDTTALDAQVAALWPNLAGTPETLFQVDPGATQQQLSAAWLFRAITSPRQLFERMVEFWGDHLNIEVAKVGYLKFVDEREVIRKHALGKFGDLIKASAKSPAMLAYLDQNVSRVGAPNQNYARELLELHTLGVDNGYTQDDVAELSRVLTGWTLAGRGNFTFNPAIHDWTQKRVMGITIPAGSPSLGQAGILEGEQIIDMLVAHPNTARYVSTKLLQWFVTPEPSATQISAVASVFRATKGDIKLVVRAVLNQGWIQAAPLKFKRPFHYLVSSIRSANMTVTNAATLNGQMNLLGQPLYLWETPDGYPDLFEYWSGNLMPRWQVASTVSAFRAGTIFFDTAAYLTGTTSAAIDKINAQFFGGEMEASQRATLLTYLNGGTFNDARVRETISLAIGSESFQWY
jgi:uncharacterized protein (DUF1800 family)